MIFYFILFLNMSVVAAESSKLIGGVKPRSANNRAEIVVAPNVKVPHRETCFHIAIDFISKTGQFPAKDHSHGILKSSAFTDPRKTVQAVSRLVRARREVRVQASKAGTRFYKKHIRSGARRDKNNFMPMPMNKVKPKVTLENQ